LPAAAAAGLAAANLPLPSCAPLCRFDCCLPPMTAACGFRTDGPAIPPSAPVSALGASEAGRGGASRAAEHASVARFDAPVSVCGVAYHLGMGLARSIYEAHAQRRGGRVTCLSAPFGLSVL